MQNRFHIIILLGLLILITSCRKDNYHLSTKDTVPDQEVFLEKILVGLVQNVSGDPVVDALVNLGEVETTTDEKGYFRLQNVGIETSGSVLNVKSDDNFLGSKVIYPSTYNQTLIEVQLIPKRVVGSFFPEMGGEVEFDGVTLLFPENAVQDESGQNFGGEVIVEAHYFDVTNPLTPLTMPGDLSAINTEDEVVQLASFGMIAVELSDVSTGNSVQIEEGKLVQANIPVPVSLQASAPDSIPMWSFNEQLGKWVEEGSASLIDGEFYRAELSHFSFWNCDAPFPVVEIKGKLVNQNNEAINHQTISINIVDSGLTSTGWTDSEGNFKGKVPKDELLTMKVNYCGEAALEQEIGPFASDTDLGTIMATIPNFLTIIKGRFVDCMGQGLPNAIGFLSGEFGYEIIIPDDEGFFSSIKTGCGFFEEYTLNATDPEKLLAAEEITFEIEQTGLKDLGDVSVCSASEEFIAYVLNDGPTNLIQDALVTIVDDTYIEINAVNEDANLEFTMLFSLDDIADDAEANFFIKGLEPNNVPRVFISQDLEVNFQTTGIVGEVITGTMTGIDELLGQTNTIEANFSFIIDRSIQTVTFSGKAWHDEDGDGIQEDGEVGAPEIDFFVFVEGGNGSAKTYYNTDSRISDENGDYIIRGFEPGESYAVLFFSQSWYTISPPDQGADDIDSDFIESSDNNFNGWRTQYFQTSDGEHYENLDAGLMPIMIDGNIEVTGCSPNATINVTVSHGIGPYEVSVNGGPVQTGFEFEFPNLSNGVHDVYIVDQTGLDVNYPTTISDDRNIAYGISFIDLPGGTDNVFDPGEYSGLSFNPISVYLENGTFVKETTFDSEGGINIENLPKERVYFEPELPTGYEFVDQNVGEESIDSDIDPMTGRSDIYDLQTCDEIVDLSIGFREL